MVNNCAAALALVATALGQGRELVWPAGELVEIGDGFRIPDLLVSHRRPAARGGDDEPGHRWPTTAARWARTPARCSRCTRRTSSSAGSPGPSTVAELAAGAGRHRDAAGRRRRHRACCARTRCCPDEPDLQSTLAAGADLVAVPAATSCSAARRPVWCSGRAELVQRLRRHPLYRALRVDKTTLAALEATLRGPLPPVRQMLDADLAGLRARAAAVAAALAAAGVRRRRRRRDRRGSAGEARRSTRCPASPSRCPSGSPSRCGGRAGRSSATWRTAARCWTCAACRRRTTTPWPSAVAGGGPAVDVIATAGHVDHGKSALVRALTGMEPDRWAEERRRGLTIDLGFAWTTLPSGRRLAVVDVPGPRAVHRQHAGRGRARCPRRWWWSRPTTGGRRRPPSTSPSSTPWACGTRLLAVTKADLADPAPGAGRRRASGWPATSMGEVPGGRGQRATGGGRAGAVRGAGAGCWPGCPHPTPRRAVRLWIDRAFTIRGAGTVVTGTLAAGTVAAGGPAATGRSGTVVVRGRAVARRRRSSAATATARVALNLRGVAVEEISRGDALLTPGAFRRTAELDVSLVGAAGGPPPRRGRSCTSARRRSARGCARWTGRSSAAAAGARRCRCGWATGCCCASPAPAGCSAPTSATSTRRSCTAGERRAPAARAELAGQPDGADGAAADLARRRIVRTRRLRGDGLAGARGEPTAVGRGCSHPGWPTTLAGRVPDVVARYRRAAPAGARAAGGGACARALELPDADLVRALSSAPPLALRDGRVVDAAAPAAAGGAARRRRDPGPAGRGPVRRAGGAGTSPPPGSGPRELAAAVRSGQLVRIADARLPGAGHRGGGPRAAGRAARSRSRSARRGRRGATSRRVAVPLMEWLDARGVTERLPDNTRRLSQRS